jgi:hypothetical protein
MGTTLSCFARGKQARVMACGSSAQSRRSVMEGLVAPGQRLAVALLLVAETLGAAACAQPRVRPDEQTLASIHALVGSARCQHDSQCRSIGIGANPCGGPEQYLAWSTIATDADELQKLVARYAEQRRKLHEQTGMSSVCVLLPEPAARCDRKGDDAAGRCVLVPVAPGRPLVR